MVGHIYITLLTKDLFADKAECVVVCEHIPLTTYREKLIDETFEVSQNSLVRSDRSVGFVELITLRKIIVCDANKFVNLFKFQHQMKIRINNQFLMYCKR